MSRIRGTGGKVDFALGGLLWRMGLRYRRKNRLPGRPDLVFSSARVVVFVDGDFWHGRWLSERIERGDFKTNADYWIPKLRRNAERDLEVTRQLQADDWMVIRIWESDAKKDLEGTADKIAETIKERLNSVSDED